MIRIALVGDIGSGKSYFSKLFGFPVFNADFAVAEIYKKNKQCFKDIKKKLPNYFSKFPLQKEELITCILSNKKNLEKITKIVHPLVKKKMDLFINKNKKNKFVILDIPLYFENKLNLKNDIVIFIKSPKTKVEKILKKRVNYNKKMITELKKIQWPIRMKEKKSNFIIKNNFKHKKALKDVRNILNNIL
tara:strand:+ start:1078 stop:1647 length:570 start_codon:yes stop_codon:yes gene_type:complete